jgi:hypothetical protein
MRIEKKKRAKKYWGREGKEGQERAKQDDTWKERNSKISSSRL